MLATMCNWYDYAMTETDMRLLNEHFKLIGTDYVDVIRGQNTPPEIVPNGPGPVMRGSRRSGEVAAALQKNEAA